MIKAVGKKFRRAMHFDFHTPPGIKNIFGNFDAEEFAERLADAKVEYINFTARCNMGFSYYNTKVGKKYEGLGERDVLRETIDACHKRGIGVTAYFNVGLDHEFAADNHGWCKIDRYGRIYGDDKTDNFFRTMCYNSPYREHLMAEVRELAEYDIDGLFCDCVSRKECFCPRCTSEMARLGYDVNNIDSALEYQKQVNFGLCREIRAAVAHKPLKIYFNGMEWYDYIQAQAEIECLATGGHWGYDYFPSAAAHARTLFEDRVYMSGRFVDEWGDFGGFKPLASMQNDLYDAMMNSFGLSFGDHLHPIDGFERAVSDSVKKVFEEKMLYEQFTDNSQNVCEIGVLVPCKYRKMPLFIKGAARLLKELKLTYNVYNEYGSFEDMKLLVIGEDMSSENDFEKRLRDYAAKGGKIIFSGEGIELAKRLGLMDYAELVGDDKSDNAYYVTPDCDTRKAVYKPGKIIKNVSGREMAGYVGNIFNMDWDGRQCYFYRAQGEKTEYSSAVLGERSACVSFDILGAYAEMLYTEHKLLFGKIVGELLRDPYIKCKDMPQTASVALTDNGEHLVFHVKSTYPEIKMGRGIIEEHNYMKSTEVSLLGEYKVVSLPDMKEVDSRTEDGRTVFETGEVCGYKAFELLKR